MPGIMDEVKKLYGQARTDTAASIDDAFAPIRKRTIETNAALGRANSPAINYNLNEVNSRQARTLGDALAGLTKDEATAGLDYQKFREGIDNQQELLSRQQSFENAWKQRNEASAGPDWMDKGNKYLTFGNNVIGLGSKLAKLGYSPK